MKIVSIVLQLIGVVAGVFLGLSMKSSGGQDGAGGSSAHAEEKHDDGHGKKEKKKGKKKDKKGGKSHGKKDGHGSGEEDAAYGFLKFSRQFIVPVVQADHVQSLVILDINLEVDPSATERAYSQEPKVRDALLRALFTLSNEGAFSGGFVDEENMEKVRTSLLTAAHGIIGDDVTEVLILNVARQDL